MKRLLSLFVAITIIFSMFSLPIGAFAEEQVIPDLLPPSNPIIKAIYTADPSAHVWPTNPDKLYLYPSRDQDPANGCDLMDKYHVYSTVDMVNWVDEGEIMNSDELVWGRTEGGFMWAPDAAYKDGTYYFYYPHPTGSSWGSTWEVGVATSKYPDRDFVDQGPVKGATTRSDATSEANRRDGMIDPNVFIDTDGTPYMFIGGSQRLYYGEMTPDLLSMKGEGSEALKRIPSAQVPSYHEGPWVFKRGDIYYLTYPGASTTVDGKRSDRMLYSTSNSVHGPWEPKGYFHNPVNTGDTSHGSVVEFKGRWFLFYHNAEISGGTGNIRSVAVDELFFNEDGSIQMVTQTTTGPKAIEGAVTPVRPRTTYPASAATIVGGAAQLTNNEGWPLGQVISGLRTTAATATFNNIDGGTGGRATIAIRYAAASRRSVRLNVNGYDWGYINLMPSSGIDVFNNEVQFTVTNMLPGAVNTVQLIGRSSGNTSYTAGDLNIAQIASIPFNDGYDYNAPKITDLAATSPLAAGYAAKVRFDIQGQNLDGKKLKAYFMNADPVEVIGTASGATGIIEIPSSIMSTQDLMEMSESKLFPIGVFVDGTKIYSLSSINVMPYNKSLWGIYTVDSEGQLKFIFNGNIQGNNLKISIDRKALNAEDFVINSDNSVLTNVPYESITEDTKLEITGIRFPQFISFSFKFSSTGPIELPPIPPEEILNLRTNGNVSRNEEVQNLIDNRTSTKWYTGTVPSAERPLYVMWEHSQPVTVDSLRIATANDMNARDPRLWTLSGSNDGVDYTVFYTSTTNMTTSRNSQSIITFPEPVTYKYYRFEVTATRTANNGCQLSEFFLIGDFNRATD